MREKRLAWHQTREQTEAEAVRETRDCWLQFLCSCWPDYGKGGYFVTAGGCWVCRAGVGGDGEVVVKVMTQKRKTKREIVRETKTGVAGRKKSVAASKMDSSRLN